MSYEPCGSPKLEGLEIILRLAQALNVEPKVMTEVLWDLAHKK